MLVVLAAESSAAVNRERLIGLLWADADEARARHAGLGVYAVRRALGAGVVVSGDVATTGRGDTSQRCGCIRCGAQRGDLEVAAGEYAGPFLDSVTLSDAQAFEQWVAACRVHYANAFVEVLRQLAANAAAGDFTPRASPAGGGERSHSSKSTRDLMRARPWRGRERGIAAGRTHGTLMRGNEAGPDPAIEALMEELRNGMLRKAPVAPRWQYQLWVSMSWWSSRSIRHVLPQRGRTRAGLSAYARSRPGGSPGCADGADGRNSGSSFGCGAQRSPAGDDDGQDFPSRGVTRRVLPRVCEHEVRRGHLRVWAGGSGSGQPSHEKHRGGNTGDRLHRVEPGSRHRRGGDTHPGHNGQYVVSALGGARCQSPLFRGLFRGRRLAATRAEYRVGHCCLGSGPGRDSAR